MTNTVTYDKIESHSYNNIFEVLNTRANVNDPRDPDKLGKRQFVYDYEPFHLSVNFNDMPYIFLSLPTTEEVKMSHDGTRKAYNFRHRVIIRTARSGASNARTDIGRTDMQNIVDDIIQTFNNRTNRETLKGLGQDKLKLFKISTDTISYDQKYAYETVYELQYEMSWLNVQD